MGSDPRDRRWFATVKGILIVWKSSPFAGRRWNGGLGRSVYVRNGSLPFRASAPATMGCPLDAEEGNVLSVSN
jgi:hypothetical protein